VTSRHPLVGAGLVLIGVTLWGVSSLFMRFALGAGLSPAQVSLYANFGTAVVLVLGLIVCAPRFLRIPPRSLPLLLAVGAVGPGLSGFCYSTATGSTSLSLATVLLYTSPAWVTLLARRFLGEPIGVRSAVAVGAAVPGVALVAQAYDPAALGGSVSGILFGLVAGFGYAVFIVLSKTALRRHHPLTVTTYGFLGATLVLVPLQQALPLAAFPAAALAWLGLYVLCSGILGGIAYNSGLRRTPAGLMSILALWSPITTLGLSAIVLGEALAPLQILGAVFVIGSIAAIRPGSEPRAAATPAPAPAG
jgi:DME family drug/metabolite transporter